MKNLTICILFVFTAFLATGQEIVSDTSYFENKENTLFYIKRQAFSDGRVRIEEIPFRNDSSEIINSIIGEHFQILTQYAEKAAYLQSNFTRQRQIINSLNNLFNSLIKQNYFSLMSNLIGDEFLGNYSIRVNGGPQIPVQIVKLQNGAVRFRQEGTNFVLDILSRNWIRIRRYQGTSTLASDTNVTVDLFFDTSTNTWIDASAGIGRITYRLKKLN